MYRLISTRGRYERVETCDSIPCTLHPGLFTRHRYLQYWIDTYPMYFCRSYCSEQFTSQREMVSQSKQSFTALANDPDLAALPVDKLGNIMQTLYICISHFSGIGKATFLKHFFQNAEFISGSSMPGNLSETKHVQKVS